MNVIGRDETSTRSADADHRPQSVRSDLALHLGAFLARDGSDGAPVGVDTNSPHAAVVFGKRGTGKSYTLGVIAEGLAGSPGVAPIVVDPMGVFGGLTAAGGQVVAPAIRPAALPAPAWPELVGLDPTSGPGSLLWQVVADAVGATGREPIDDADETDAPDGNGGEECVTGSNSGERLSHGSPSIDCLLRAVSDADAPPSTRRVVRNHLRLADSWNVFDADSPPVASFTRGGRPTVVDLAGVPEAAAAAVVRAIARGLYDARIAGEVERLPWLLIDEAHAFFGGVADPALRTLLTRGRAPGVSLVCATQRPGSLPSVVVSQSDLLVAHRLTAAPDVERLAAAEATYLAGDLASRLPTGTGEALVVDDATETVHTVRIRERRTPHGGESPTASRVDVDDE
ncbi:MAG: DUF87 domain-containing protein [Halorubrum sp.]